MQGKASPDPGSVPGELTLADFRCHVTDDDGSLPDGVVEGSGSPSDWMSVLTLIRARDWRAQWLDDPPEVVDTDERFAEGGTLAVEPVPGLQINFFAGGDVRFDIDRREVSSEARARALGGFLRDLGTCLGREITLTYEGSIAAFLRYRPGTDRFDWLP